LSGLIRNRSVGVQHRNELIGIEAVAIAIVGADVFFPMIRARRDSSLKSTFPFHGMVKAPGLRR